MQKYMLGPYKGDPEGLQVWGKDRKDGEVHVLDIRGWGYLTGGAALNLPEKVAIEEQKAFQDFVVRALNSAWESSGAGRDSFQARVAPWLQKCFGHEIASDVVERNHRFLEEALELVESLGCTREEAHQLVDYVYDLPVGDPPQEVGGVMVTLAALCLANDLDMHEDGETELARVWTKIDKIREKQAAKPRGSALPAAGALQLIEVLTREEGSAVTILSENPEGNGPDSHAVEVCGLATGWREVRYYSRTTIEALRAAHKELGCATIEAEATN